MAPWNALHRNRRRWPPAAFRLRCHHPQRALSFNAPTLPVFFLSLHSLASELKALSVPTTQPRTGQTQTLRLLGSDRHHTARARASGRLPALQPQAITCLLLCFSTVGLPPPPHPVPHPACSQLSFYSLPEDGQPSPTEAIGHLPSPTPCSGAPFLRPFLPGRILRPAGAALSEATFKGYPVNK